MRTLRTMRSFTVVVVIAFLVTACGSARPDVQLAEPPAATGWPVYLRYERTDLLPGGPTASLIAEFVADDWTAWTHLVVEDLETEEGDRFAGALDQYAGGVHIGGGVAPHAGGARRIHDTGLPDRFTAAVGDRAALESARQPVAERQASLGQESATRRAPSDTLNPLFGSDDFSRADWLTTVPPDETAREALPHEHGWDADATAERLGLDRERIGQVAVTESHCATDPADDDCERWIAVYEIGTEMPLEVQWVRRGGHTTLLYVHASEFGDVPRRD